MLHELFEKLSPDALILTANSRLTRTLRSAFDNYQQVQQNTTWETPIILPLQGWLEQQFHQANTDGKLLLTNFQEMCIWQDIIQRSSLTTELLQPIQLVKLVQQAFETFTLWNVSLDELQPYREQTEAQCLLEWITAFQQGCITKEWISQAELPNFLLAHDMRSPLCLPSQILFIGFDDINPAMRELLHHFEKRVSICHVMLSEKTQTKYQLILENEDTEIQTMARWAKAQWQENPQKQIGCVIPNLGNIRTKVQRIFTEIFNNEMILPGAHHHLPPFNISAGLPLSRHSMIHTALSLLKWCARDLPIQELSLLMQSPYLCVNDDEKNMGAQIDTFIRNQNKISVSITDLYSAVGILQARYSKANLLTRWRSYIALYQDIKTTQQAPSQWATHFIHALKVIGWPSQHTQNTVEFQVFERFKKVLLEFSQLDIVFSQLNFQSALQLLTLLTQQTIFQPKSHDEPIQIMGALEAGGILFESLWVMGLHDGVWPMPSKPHPLIPYTIQQHYQMPHATAKRELQFCEQLTHRLENAAKQVIFSSPLKEGDQQFAPSRLIQHIPIIQQNKLTLSENNLLSEIMFHSRQMEAFEDNAAPTITDFSAIRGGSTILKLQALCPFRAFATIRLSARSLNTPVIGITPIIKGILVHHILFELWGELNDQQTLAQLTDESLTALIKQAIDKTYAQTDYQRHQSHNDYFFHIEKIRLQQLVKEWLLHEKTRPYFRVIAREKEMQVKIGALPISLRLDRIDQLSDGTLFLMDYKTGSTNINGWFQERLTDPQLPIYAAFQTDATHRFTGIGFAEVRAADMVFNGVLHENHLYAKQMVSKLKPIHRIEKKTEMYTWDGLILAWKQSIEKLANDFCNGVALVDPVNNDACKHCEIKPICRHNGEI